MTQITVNHDRQKLARRTLIATAVLLLFIAVSYVFTRHMLQRPIIRTLIFSTDSKSLLAGGGRIVPHDGDELRGTIWVWNAGTGQLQSSFNSQLSNVYKLMFSPDGDLLVTFDGDEGAENLPISKIFGEGTAPHSQNWDPKELARLSERANRMSKIILANPKEELRNVAMGLYGKRLAVASTTSDLDIYNLDTGKLEARLAGAAKTYSRADAHSFSRDSKTLAVCQDQGVQVWDAENGKLLTTLSDPGLSARFVVFSNDGTKIAAADNESARIWDAKTYRLIGQCKIPWVLF